MCRLFLLSQWLISISLTLLLNNKTL
ncbi:unnamed protein product [Phytomonas sp. Hart1]|nr:unnamed protein product [Phytomonas sp. Hart1]|eukprot:CCW68199.1 unnamed protein product [Phytomonas sp. isolate Hart1]